MFFVRLSSLPSSLHFQANNREGRKKERKKRKKKRKKKKGISKRKFVSSRVSPPRLLFPLRKFVSRFPAKVAVSVVPVPAEVAVPVVPVPAVPVCRRSPGFFLFFLPPGSAVPRLLCRRLPPSRLPFPVSSAVAAAAAADMPSM